MLLWLTRLLTMHSRGRPAIASHVGVPSLAKPRAASLSANVRARKLTCRSYVV